MRYNRELNANLRAVITQRPDNNELQKRVASGDKEARDKMVEQNTPLALKLVEQFISNHPDFDYMQDDLTSAAMLGLVEAVDDCSRPGFVSSGMSAYLGRALFHAIKREAKHTDLTVPTEFLDELCFADEPTTDLEETILSCCETETDRQIVVLRAQKHTQTAISQLLGIPQTTISNRLKRIYKNFEEKENLMCKQG